MIGTLSKEQPEMGQMINGLMQSLGNINEPPSDKKE
jgi:hypothetical protein